jgi:hypothetical protein
MAIFKRAVFSTMVLAAACLATGAEAGECKRLAAAGDGVTKSLAEFMAGKGLENVIKGYGMTGQGPVKMTCDVGTVYTECHASQLACK